MPRPFQKAPFSFWHHCCFSGMSSGRKRFEKPSKLCLSVIHTSCSRECWQPLVKNTISSMAILAGLAILLSGACSRGGVGLPRWVLEGKEELPHGAGMTSSLCTGPPFHMRSNPPTLFSLPVSLRRKQHSVARVAGKINAKPAPQAWDRVLVFPLVVPPREWQNEPQVLYLRSISTTFRVSSNSRNFIS